MNSCCLFRRGLALYRLKYKSKAHAPKRNLSTINPTFIESSPSSTASLKQSPTSESTSTTVSKNRLHIAIVGSGPAGCYTAKYLLSSFEKQQYQQPKQTTLSHVDITVLDRLPTPFGLLRSGVAPDHPEVRNVEHDFHAMFRNYPEKQRDENHDSTKKISLSLAFRGHIHVGNPTVVSLSELQSLFDVVVLAYGCTDSDIKLHTEDASTHTGPLKGIFSAREFVAWYNGHPDYVALSAQLKDILISSSSSETKQPTNIVIIGNGNVALDCARILAKGTCSFEELASVQQGSLADTDIATYALDLLSQCKIQSVRILGRRSHVQGAFTIKELRELTKLRDDGFPVSFVVSQQDLDSALTDSSKEELTMSKPKARIDQLLRDVAARSLMDSSSDKSSETTSKNSVMQSHHQSKTIELRFLLNPIRFIPNPSDPSKVGSLLCQRTELHGPPGHQVAVGKQNDFVEFPADMVLVSIGYKAISLPGMDETNFDFKRGIVRNNRGKIFGFSGGFYVSGWLKRGPNGIVGTNIADAKETVQSVLDDLDQGNIVLKNIGRDGLDHILRERLCPIVDWDKYLLIDAKEKESSRLRSLHQPREKIVSIEEMMDLISKP